MRRTIDIGAARAVRAGRHRGGVTGVGPGRGLLLLALLFTAAAFLALGSVPARAAANAHARTTRVTVAMKEFRFVLSVRSVRRGTVVFELVNRGHLAHDFKIAGKKSALIAPGKRGSLRVVFHRAGRYPYLCTVPGHAAAGMKGTLRVR